MARSMRLDGMRSFLLIWLGQSVSLLSTNLVGFALGVWVYQRTGSITRFTLIALVTTLPGIVVSPLAGVLVDRWDRRRAMILGDGGAALCALLMALLLSAGSLGTWQLCLLMGVSSMFSAIQWPALSAATTQMVPKQQLARASGLIQLGQAVAQIGAPMMAGYLLSVIGVGGILLFDVASYGIAILTVLLARAPGAPREGELAANRAPLLAEARLGWTYIAERPGLLALLLFFGITNFTVGTVTALMTPLILSMASAEDLGVVVSVAGVGMLLGSVVMSAWGGPARRVRGVLGFTLLQGALLLVVGLSPSVGLIGAGAFLFLFCTPMIIGASQTIWQSKVALDLQGRVFAIRRMIAWSTTPLAYLLAGPLVDRVFRPLSQALGLSARAPGSAGEGTAIAIGLLFSALGAGTILVTAAGWWSRRLQRVEEELPDAIGEPAIEQPPSSARAG